MNNKNDRTYPGIDSLCGLKTEGSEDKIPRTEHSEARINLWKEVAKQHINHDQPESDEEVFYRGDLRKDAPLYKIDNSLKVLVDAAIKIRKPILLTGDPGCGKSQLAYYLAYLSGMIKNEPFIYNVKSNSKASDLFYHFDAVRYFYLAQSRGGDMNFQSLSGEDKKAGFLKEGVIQKGAFWNAFEYGQEKKVPAVVLIDEIDKGQRDFPNDLLYELDQMIFNIIELGDQGQMDFRDSERPVVIITSNEERPLPRPFLRRCFFYHIQQDDDLIREIVESHKSSYPNLGDKYLKMVLGCFLRLRKKSIVPHPGVSELLTWLQALNYHEKIPEKVFETDNFDDLPLYGVVFKGTHRRKR